MKLAYLLLGSNEGDRRNWIDRAKKSIAEFGEIVACSSLYETAAWGLEDQPDFLNQVLSIETALDALSLLDRVQQIEHTLGRQRTTQWGQRTLDIDILFYDKDIIQTKVLTVPHPFLQDRRFTLVPLTEIAPELMHPKLKKTAAALLEACTDHGQVRKIL